MFKIIISVVLQSIVYNFITCEVPINCNEENVMRCWSYIEGTGPLQFVLPSLNRSSLTDFCGKFDYFDKCFSQVRTNCVNIVRFAILVHFEGHRNGFSYICREATGEYLTHQPCFDDQSLQANIRICNETLTEQIKRVHNESDSVKATNRLCQAGDLYLGCIDNNVKVICEEAAAGWIKNYIKRVLSPLLSSIPCKGWSYDITTPAKDDTISISLAVCLSLICIIIVILVFIFICHLKPQLFKSLPIMKRVNNAKLFSSFKPEVSCPPPYVINSQPSSSSTEPNTDTQTGPTDQGSFSSGYFSTAERSPDDSTQQYFHELNSSTINRRVGSVDVISFDASGVSRKCKTLRSHSAECTPELPRFLQHSISLTPLQSSAITPPLFEPPVANPFTSRVINAKDDPIITDYYC